MKASELKRRIQEMEDQIRNNTLPKLSIEEQLAEIEKDPVLTPEQKAELSAAVEVNDQNKMIDMLADNMVTLVELLVGHNKEGRFLDAMQLAGDLRGMVASTFPNGIGEVHSQHLMKIITKTIMKVGPDNSTILMAAFWSVAENYGRRIMAEEFKGQIKQELTKRGEENNGPQG
jgi:hypothetical protein